MPFFKCNPTYYSLELPYGIMEKQVILIRRHLNLYRRTEIKMKVRKNSVNSLLIFTFIIEMNVNQYSIWWSFFPNQRKCSVIMYFQVIFANIDSMIKNIALA